MLGNMQKIRDVYGEGVDDLARSYIALRDLALNESSGPSSAYSAVCRELGIRPVKNFTSALEQHSTTLDFARDYVSVQHVLAIAATLPLCTWVTFVDFSSSRLDAPLLMIVCDALSSMSSLKRVDFSRNPFGSLGASCALELKRRCNAEVIVDNVEIIPAIRKRLSD